MRIAWTRRYLSELAAIGDYIADHNPNAAGRVVEQIHTKTARLLSDNPFIGHTGEIAGTRELVIPGTPYIVAYRVTDTQVEVLFVRHGARQWPDEMYAPQTSPRSTLEYGAHDGTFSLNRPRTIIA